MEYEVTGTIEEEKQGERGRRGETKARRTASAETSVEYQVSGVIEWENENDNLDQEDGDKYGDEDEAEGGMYDSDTERSLS